MSEVKPLMCLSAKGQEQRRSLVPAPADFFLKNKTKQKTLKEISCSGQNFLLEFCFLLKSG